MTNATASAASGSTGPAGHRHIDWQYEPSDEELIEAQFPASGQADDALVGPLGAKAIASVSGAISTSLLMTPFDVLKTRLQTVRPSQTILPSATPASVETICCQTAVLPTSDGSAQAGPGPSSLRQRIAPTSSAPLNTANATCLGATIPSSSARPSFMPSFSATIGRPGIQAGTIQASGATLVPPAPEGCLHPSKWAGIWGEIVTQEEAERIRRSPLLGGKGITALQEQAREGAKELSRKLAGAGAEGGFFNEIKVIMAEPAGWRGLWKGVGTGLVMSIPSASIYMLGYEYLLVALNGRIPGSTTTISGNQVVITPQHTTLELSNGSTAQSAQSTSPTAGQKQAYLSPVPFVAGSMARTISATVISPIELFRTRLQALPAPGQPAPSYASTFSSITTMVKEQGTRALWRGLGPTLWRDVPFSGLYWAGFESLKRYFTESQLIQPGITMTFISGALSGTAASLVTSPFDVLKTRRQVFTPSKACSPEALAHPASTMPLLRHIVQTEGWKALFAGVVPRTAKVAPACGMMIAAYEGVGHLLGGKAADRNA